MIIPRLPTGMHFKCDFIPVDPSSSTPTMELTGQEATIATIEMDLCRENTALWNDILDRRDERWKSDCMGSMK